jgi:hypothetical protein
MNWSKTPVCFYFLFTQKLNCSAKKHFINNKQIPEFQESIASFSSVQCSSWPFNSQFGWFFVVAMLVWTHILRCITEKLRHCRGTARPGTRETPASLMAWKERHWNRIFIIQIKCNIKYNAKQINYKIHNLNSSVYKSKSK